MQFGIIAIGYNRKESLTRLLDRLNECFYDEEVLLIISIDFSGIECVNNSAKDFAWKHGDKVVIAYPERLGLKKHILLCGSYMEKYNLDAVAVFEDDTYPSIGFYSYMKQAVSFYEADDRIAGISLYTHFRNPPANLPFQPQISPYDVFFMQFAQSWGQVWMRKQWNDFAKWYKENPDGFSDLAYIPRNICKWSSDTSWLKFHIRYCVEKNKYFVYPYCSLSTCFSDIGEHAQRKKTHCQVPLQMGKDMQYRFPELNCKDALHYDVFFENIDITKYFTDKNVCIDFYGQKSNYENRKYWLTTKKLDFKIVESFAMELKPQELNYLYRIPGNDIYLYDTSKADSNKELKKGAVANWEYYYSEVSPLGISIKKCYEDLGMKVIQKIKKYFRF